MGRNANNETKFLITQSNQMKNSEEKYQWRINRQPPELQQHSAVKHKIIESYIRDYILTLMAPANIPRLKLSLIDGFSGGGQYVSENGDFVDGSPLLMLSAVQSSRIHLNLGRDKPRNIDVSYEFIDIRQDTIDYLDLLLDARYHEKKVDPLDRPKIKTTCGSFIDELPRLINSIKHAKSGERAIFVLDQYNYDEIPLSAIRWILSTLAGAEVIFTFNVGSLITYLSDHAASRRPMEKIGLASYIPWNQINNIKAEEKQRWRAILQKHLASGIQKESGANFMTPFFVRPHGANTWDYWLIHLSNHYRAHDVMKNLHWQHGNMFGHELGHGVFLQGYNANLDELYTGQNQLFDENASNMCIDNMMESFGDLIYKSADGVKVKELFTSCISKSTGAERHFQIATNHLHQQKDVIVLGADGRIRRPSKYYKRDDIIIRSPQLSLPNIKHSQ
jgi:three-Cys-motif partner protein